MSRVWKRLDGNGGGGDFVGGEDYTLDRHVQPSRQNFDLCALGAFQRNGHACGSDVLGIDASATGDQPLLNWFPIEYDNSAGQLTGFSDANGAVQYWRARFILRVSNAAINITPKILYGSAIGSIATVATLSGAAACSATAADYSGANQYQTVLITLPSGVKLWRPYVTIAGTPGAGYQAFAMAVFEQFIAS